MAASPDRPSASLPARRSSASAVLARLAFALSVVAPPALVAPAGLGAQAASAASVMWIASPTDPEPVGTGTAVGQVALGTLGTVGGFVGGGLATRWAVTQLGASPDQASRLALVGAWTTAALATPVGPAILGSRGDVRGSYPVALGGALAGGAASLLVVTAGRRGAFDCRACAPVRILAGVSAAVLPSLGATLAFNASRKIR